MTVTPPITEPGLPLREEVARRHLLLSFPLLDELESGTDAVDRLIEGAICSLRSLPNAPVVLLVPEVTDAIRDMVALQYDSAEVIASLERLQFAGVVRFVKEDKRSFVFDDKRLATLTKEQEFRRERLAAVRREWFDDLELRHGLTPEDCEALWGAVDQFTAQMLNTYSAEAAAFLYQRTDEDIGAEGRERFAQVLQQRMPLLDEVVPEHLLSIARTEIAKFYASTSAARTEYLMHCLRGAFVYHLLSIDPNASELMLANVANKRFYLDTNFIYRLLGFGGPTRAFGPHAVVSMAKALNCELWIAGETEAEFLRKLRSEVRDLRRHPIHQAAYQRIIVDHPGDEYSFMQAFYREYQEGKIRSYDQFERKYETVEQILAPYKIRIDQKAILEETEARSEEFLDLQSKFNTWTGEQRHLDAVAHDAFMLRFIREKRGRRDRTAGTVQTWLLTYDRGLTAFSVFHARDDQLPACLLGDDWLQVARPFLPRTADYDQSFLALLRNTITFDDPSLVPLQVMVEALERLDSMQELPPAVIAGMVTNHALLNRIRLAQDDAAVKALVEIEAAQYAIEKEKEVARLAQQTAELRERVEQLSTATGEYRTRHQSAAEEAAAAGRERDTARAEVESLKAEIAEMPKLIAAARDTATAEVLKQIPDLVQQAVLAERETRDRSIKQAARRLGCFALWVAIAGGTFWLYRHSSQAQSPLGAFLLAASFIVLTHAIWRFAKDGRVEGGLGRIADVLGIIAYVVLLAQTFATDSEGGRNSSAPASMLDRPKVGAPHEESSRPSVPGTGRSEPSPRASAHEDTSSGRRPTAVRRTAR